MKKKIVWERVNSDTFKSEFSEDLDNDVEEFEDSSGQNGGMQELIMEMQGNVDHTLMGVFAKDNIYHPDNLYSYDFIYLGHLIGFNCNSENFYKIHKNKRYTVMDLMEGVSIWKVIDTHKIAFIPAKYYDAEDVINTIAKNLQLEINNNEDDEDNEGNVGEDIPLAIINECINKSTEFGDKKHIVMYLPNKTIISYYEDDEDYETRLKECKEIYQLHPEESMLIINGDMV